MAAPAPVEQKTAEEIEAESFALAWRLQQEEDTRIAEEHAVDARLPHESEDAESLALAIRLQQEDDESALRAALGVEEGGDDPGSPSQYSYEQLMRLSQTVGEVSRGASLQVIEALRTMTCEEARNDPSIVLGEQVCTVPNSTSNAQCCAKRTARQLSNAFLSNCST